MPILREVGRGSESDWGFLANGQFRIFYNDDHAAGATLMFERDHHVKEASAK
jgi:hypothetical protein